MPVELHEELTAHANKARTREDISNLDVVTVAGVPPFWLMAKVGTNEEARSYVAALDDTVGSSKGFIDEMAARGLL